MTTGEKVESPDANVVGGLRRLIWCILDGLDDGSVRMSTHREDLFRGIYREAIERELI